MKLAFFFILYLHIGNWAYTQVWEYPVYTIENLNKKERYASMELVFVDSSYYGINKRQIKYDSYGNKTKEINTNDTIVYQYDEYGHLIKETSTLSGIKENIYFRNKKGKIKKKISTINRDTVITIYNRDSSDNIIAISVDNEIRKEFQYDSQNRVILVKEYLHNNSTLSSVKTYEYKQDTIVIKNCGYNIDGKRYSFPCEQKIGILNSNDNLVELWEIYETPTDTVHSKYSYNSENKPTKIITNDIGRTQEMNIYYNNSEYEELIEVQIDSEIYRTIKVKRID